MVIKNITEFEIALEDENHNVSHVHQQGDGKWKCQRCNRYRCQHVQFVQENKVQLLPRRPVKADDVEILTY